MSKETNTDTVIASNTQVPNGAYRDDVYVPGDSLPKTDFKYSTYKFVGHMPLSGEDDFDRSVARTRARAKFGPAVSVFRTARGWVVHEGR